MNGLLRLHFPKGVNLEEVIQDEIIAAMCHHSWRDQENVWGSRLPMQLFWIRLTSKQKVLRFQIETARH